MAKQGRGRFFVQASTNAWNWFGTGLDHWGRLLLIAVLFGIPSIGFAWKQHSLAGLLDAFLLVGFVAFGEGAYQVWKESEQRLAESAKLGEVVVVEALEVVDPEWFHTPRNSQVPPHDLIMGFRLPFYSANRSTTRTANLRVRCDVTVHNFDPPVRVCSDPNGYTDTTADHLPNFLHVEPGEHRKGPMYFWAPIPPDARWSGPGGPWLFSDGVLHVRDEQTGAEADCPIPGRLELRSQNRQ